MPTEKPKAPVKKDAPVEVDITAASLEDLNAHRTSLIEELKALRPESKEALAAMSDEEREALKSKREEINTKIQAVDAEKTARAEKEAAAEAELAEFDAAVAQLEPVEEEAPETEEAEPETEPEAKEPEPEKKEEAPAKVVPLAAAVKPVKIPVTASVPSPKDVKPPKGSEVKPELPVSAITAAGSVDGFNIGQTMTSQELGRAMADKLNAAISSTSAPKAIVASMHGSFPEDRILGRDYDLNNQRLDSMYHQVSTMDGLEKALTAAICAPGTPVYDFRSISTDERPLFNGLPAFGTEANRGRVIYQQPVSITDVTGALTNITDLAGTPTPASKNVLTVTCGTDVTATIEAWAMRLKIDNFNRMTFEERWDHFWEQARAALARARESRMLQIIDDSANTRTATKLSTQLGAARDLFDAWTLAATALRSAFRMNPEAPVTVVAPDWVKTAIAVDLMKGVPGDNAMGRGRAFADEIARGHNLNMIWHLDTPAGAGQTNQIYPLQTDGGALTDWIDTVVSYVFPPATWFTLTGPTIDLGTDIRDSTLNALNQVEGFVEYFETVAFRGEVGSSLRITNKICVSGKSTAAVAYVCPAGS